MYLFLFGPRLTGANYTLVFTLCGETSENKCQLQDAKKTAVYVGRNQYQLQNAKKSKLFAAGYIVYIMRN